MRINKIENKKVDVTLSSSELTLLQNVMYFYESNQNDVIMQQKFHELSEEIMIANNICQYGGIDNFALDAIMRHSILSNPGKRINEFNELKSKINKKYGE